MSQGAPLTRSAAAAARIEVTEALVSPSEVVDLTVRYTAILSLPLPQLKIQLNDANSQDLRGLRSFLSLGSGGTKEDNKSLLYDHIEASRNTPALLSPEGRDGRERAIRPGGAAAKFRAAAQDLKPKVQALTTPARADRAVVNSVVAGPQAWHLIPEIPMYASVSKLVCNLTLSQNLPPDILGAKARVAELPSCASRWR